MPERKCLPAPCEESAIAAALHAEARATADLAFGRGKRYEVAGGQASLEIFPEHRMSRITTPTSRLELFDAPAPQVVDGHVVISRKSSQEELSLSVSPEGAVVFGYVARPSAPTESESAPDEPTTAAATTPQRPQEPSAVTPATDGPSTANRTHPEPLSPVPAGSGLRPSVGTQHHPGATGSLSALSCRQAGDRQGLPDTLPPTHTTRTDHPAEAQPRVQLTGRLGRDPSFRTSPRGTLIGRFPLAVHRDDGTTVWHTILAFGQRAQLLQHRSDAGELTKGQEVSLIGYQHTRAQPTRDGGSKTVTEIYAVAVTRR